jgi:hypothetical protein
MSLIFKESNPYSPDGWDPCSIVEELLPYQTPTGITMPEHKGLIQSVIFDSTVAPQESTVYLASPIINFAGTTDVVGEMQPLAILKPGESFYFAADDYIKAEEPFEYYPQVVRVTQT